MNQARHVPEPLDLDDYRALVALDAPVRPTEPATALSRARVISDLVGALVSGGAADALGISLADYTRLFLGERQDRRLLRTLLTVRGPNPLSSGFVARLDSLLQLELAERGRVEVDHLARIHATLPGTTYPAAAQTALWQGDITRLAADAIVNAANSRMLGCFVPFHDCIDNAIHSAAGPRLREDCDRIVRRQGTPEPTGVAKATRAYNLPARFVLHTVGPIVTDEVEARHQASLESCYRACLDLASRLPGVRSLAFCGISTGVFGYPKAPAARVALRTVADWLRAHTGALDLVIFDVFGDEDLAVYREALAEYDAPRNHRGS